MLKELDTRSVIVHDNKSFGEKIIVNVHYHYYIEILYTYKGDFKIWLDGKFYNFSKGDLVVINSQETHMIEHLSKDMDDGYICLRFTPDLLFGDFQQNFELKYVLPFMTNHNPPQKVFKKAQISETDIPELMYNILEEFNKKEYAFELSVKSDIYRIFLWILRHWHKEGLEIDNNVNVDLTTRLKPVIEYISEHYSEPITAMEMAEYVNLSYSYFSRNFKQLTQKGFSEYLNYIRIIKSETLLLTTDMTVTEIALQVGFSTSSYYIQQFRHYKNCSPKQFKKAFMSGNKNAFL
jgi:AraC-like DNA-binding protein